MSLRRLLLSSVRRSRQLLLGAAIAVFSANILSGPAVVSLAADDPQPDPAGIATGDKSTAVDAAGNPFVVPEPTDETAPDYAQKKKDFDESQEPSRRSVRERQRDYRPRRRQWTCHP